MCFFFNDTATTEIYTLSLHDALPISRSCRQRKASPGRPPREAEPEESSRELPAAKSFVPARATKIRSNQARSTNLRGSSRRGREHVESRAGRRWLPRR